MSKNIHSEIKRTLSSMASEHRKKHQDKINGVDTSRYIYSFGTLKQYLKVCNLFADYCMQKYDCQTLNEARAYVDEWLNIIYATYSAYTCATYKCALVKLYQLNADELPKPPIRTREEVTRCREDYDEPLTKFEKAKLDIIKFCESTGLRRRELINIRGSDIEKRGNHFVVHVNKGGKGGRKREVHAIKFENTIERLKSESGGGKLFDWIPNGISVHKFRAKFAHDLYEKVARKIEDLNDDEVYVCRKDMKGIVLDRKAMEIVSKNLGHNRIDVIAQSYLYGLYLDYKKKNNPDNDKK